MPMRNGRYVPHQNGQRPPSPYTQNPRMYKNLKKVKAKKDPVSNWTKLFLILMSPLILIALYNIVVVWLK